MKVHIYVVSTGVIAFGILGGNFTFNELQCKRWNSTNNTNYFDHVCLYEWCSTVCHTSGLLVTASPWILLALLCTITSISVYYLTLSHDDDDDDSVYDIRVSLCALSLDHDKQHSSNHSNTSWFSELNKLDLLNVGSPLPVTMDTANRQIISPPKLKLHKTFSSHSNHWSNGLRENNYTTINHKQYYIIILSCLLSVSIMCNVVLIYWIT